jgi:hypothetical protein
MSRGNLPSLDVSRAALVSAAAPDLIKHRVENLVMLLRT